ncbi:MAG: thiamine-phosphate kinase [Thermodesulfobacteriota bacterium]|nr:thiamine-phosphate kinase [Thermodesulfobacteriota bacterium]
MGNKTLETIGEFGVIDIFKSQQKVHTSKVITGIGDDCAVFKTDTESCSLITTDMLVEEVHFTLDTTSSYLLGKKSLSVNLSDIAAMGGIPTFAFLTLAVSRDTHVEYLETFAQGFYNVAQKWDVQLLGGDTVASPSFLIINVTLFGEVRREELLLRSRAQPGDVIFVSGYLGDSKAGLTLLRSCDYHEKDEYPELVAAHLDPVPQIDMGRVLAQTHTVNGVIDISDGVVSDLGHICDESKVGGIIDISKLPISKGCKMFATKKGMMPYEFALYGGEDYQLLFTVPQEKKERIEEIVEYKCGKKIYDIGTIIEGSGVHIKEGEDVKPAAQGGYDHFAGR